MIQLPKGWRTFSLGDLAGPKGLLSDGDWIESKDQDPTGTIRLTQLADIGDGKFLNKSARYINSKTAARLRCSFLEKGDLLIARMPDPLGRACIFPGMQQPAITAVDVFIWRTDGSRADARWVMYTINGPDMREQIQREAGGTTRQRVAGGKLKRITLPTPPLTEQRRIVAKLDGLTGRTARAREELGRIPRLIQKYREAILAASFSGEITREWREARSFPALRPGKVNDLIAVPIRNGLSIRGNESPPGQRSLRLSALRSPIVDLDDVRYLPINESRASRYLLNTGDILVSRGNGTKAFVGIASLVPDIVQPTIFPDTAFRIRLARSNASPSWFTSIWERASTQDPD